MTAPVRRLWSDVCDLCAAWTRFWFEPQDVATVCWLRLLAGGMILYTHLVWSLQLDAFFGSDGWQPVDVVQNLREGDAFWSFWWYVPDQYLWPAHFAALIVLAMFFIGFWTPVTSKLTYLIVVSYAHRVPLANFGLDQINAFLALYLAIAPCGRFVSVDWLLRRRRHRRKALLAGLLPSELPAERSWRARLSTRLTQIQLCVLYTYAGIAKLKGTAWWDGNAIWMALANEEYQSTPLMWLAQWQPVTELITHATIAWECSFWALIWVPRLRPYVLLGGVAMHLGIGAFMGMWTFGLVMTFAYQAFTSPSWIRSVAESLGLYCFGVEASKNTAPRPNDTFFDKAESASSDNGTPILAFIDDDAEVRRHATDYFSQHGYRAFASASLSGIETPHAPDVIVLDAVDRTPSPGLVAGRSSSTLVVITDEAHRDAWHEHADAVLIGPVPMRHVRRTIQSLTHSITDESKEAIRVQS